jgi:hypothetical protein
MNDEQGPVDGADRRAGAEDRSADAENRFGGDESDADSADPYDVELPAGWTARCLDRTTVYENDAGDHRVRVVEFSKGLSLYWWVDVFDRDGVEWRRREVGLGDSYTDPDQAAAEVEAYLSAVAGGAAAGSG